MKYGSPGETCFLIKNIHVENKFSLYSKRSKMMKMESTLLPTSSLHILATDASWDESEPILNTRYWTPFPPLHRPKFVILGWYQHFLTTWAPWRTKNVPNWQYNFLPSYIIDEGYFRKKFYPLRWLMWVYSGCIPSPGKYLSHLNFRPQAIFAHLYFHAIYIRSLWISFPLI